MQRLVEGLHYFQSEIFGSQRALFERLALGQKPETMFITCADSRIDPNLLTQTAPGELFIMRNAGNFVPPYNPHSGEAATIEFAVAAIGVQDIVVCGHSHCGAVEAILDPPPPARFPALTNWLSNAEATRRILRDKYPEADPTRLLNVAVQENVLMQLENLRTHPVVASGLAQGKLNLHGWVYKIETGEVFGYDPQARQFNPLTLHREGEGAAAPPAARGV